METSKFNVAIIAGLVAYGTGQSIVAHPNLINAPQNSADTNNQNNSESNDFKSFHVYDINSSPLICENLTATQNTCAQNKQMRPLTSTEIKSLLLTPEERKLTMGANATTVTSHSTRIGVTSGSCTANGCNVRGYPSTVHTLPPPPSTGHPGTGGGGDKSTDCFTPLTSENRADKNYVFMNEGGIKTTGYLLPNDSSAGVTIGAGVDLGQQSATSLEAAGVPESIISGLTNYFGKKGSAAATAVNQYGEPTLSEADATTLSDDVFNYDVQQFAYNYDAAVSGYTFYQLPADTQTAIIDVTYPNGVNLASSAPNFWSDITKGDWSKAVDELNNWNDDSGTKEPTRYSDDANTLNNDITAGSLPATDSGGVCN